ncbi:MAG: hypothetical protein ACLSA6_05000 [Holdemania massiliensis]
MEGLISKIKEEKNEKYETEDRASLAKKSSFILRLFIIYFSLTSWVYRCRFKVYQWHFNHKERGTEDG